MKTDYHVPVFLHQAVRALKVTRGRRYIDATIGNGGHAEAILKLGGKVLGTDRDPEAIKITRERLGDYVESEKLILVRANFCEIKSVAREKKFDIVDGILFDLGLSSWQLERSNRGFTFLKDEPLDMRMDPDLSVKAADLLAVLGKKELTELLMKFGQVERARAVSGAIVAARRVKPITTTGELVEIVEGVLPRRGRLHPATKVFMSLRIAINDELGNLRQGLPEAVSLLASAGRLVVISFHEGEDRIVKQFMKTHSDLRVLTKKPVRPTDEEVRENPRAGSGRMRVAQLLEKEDK